MTLRRTILLSVLLFVLALAVGVVQAQGPNPSHSGQVNVPGLNDRVEILRDEWGVPHIYASNAYDLFFAQGYTQAQDRWWQMEFSRHIGGGSIQELTGRNDSLMGTDLFLRTLGFRHVVERELAETYTEAEISLLQAFADGVNAYILDRPQTELAIEYGLLRFSGVTVPMEPWTVVDSITWAKIMSLDLGGNYSRELLYSRVAPVVGEELFNEWSVDWPFGEKPTIFMLEDLEAMLEGASAPRPTQVADAGISGLETNLAGNFTEEMLAALPFGYGPEIGSNNWVTHGSITETGAPLMANDMHLGLNMPSIWYEVGLHCQPVSAECPYNVAGFAFSSLPGVVAGHNDHISWAFTNVGPDTQDLYLIRVNPDNPLQYEYDGEWRDMIVREEVINFGNGADPVTMQIRHTHHGPIINDNQIDADGSIMGFNNDNPLALRWTSLESGTILRALPLLNTASNYEEFREALRFWDTAAQNVIYADVEGNIGYQMPGNIPIRAANHSGMMPVPGWTSEFEWRGYIPFDSLPRIFNPARGWIATANQAAVPLEYYGMLEAQLGGDANYIISQSWDYGYRGERIVDLLESLAPHNHATFQQIHGDNWNGSAAEILPFMAEIAIDDADLAELRDWLVDWDYLFDVDSPQAALYAYFWSYLISNTIDDEFLGTRSASGTQNEWRLAYLLMQDPENHWWDDITTPDVTETRDDIVIRSLQEAHDATVEALGADRDGWSWGGLHTITFVSNPLGLSGIGSVEAMVNRGPFPVGGSNNAVNAVSWRAFNFAASSGPSERVIYDLSDWDNSLSMHTTGQSGHPASQHYANMIDPWLNVEYRPMLWSRERVEAAAVDTLILLPGN